MSLVVVLSDATSLCITADTRAVSTRDGPLPNPVLKLSIITCEHNPILIATAGDTEISGLCLLEHVRSHAQWFFTAEGRYAFSQYLHDVWHYQIMTEKWDSKEDKEEYIKDAHITILIALAFDEVFLFDGRVGDIILNQLVIPGVVITFGMPDLVKAYLEKPPEHKAGWIPFLAEVYSIAAEKSMFVAAPVDVALWPVNGKPSVQRFATCQELSEYLIP